MAGLFVSAFSKFIFVSGSASLVHNVRAPSASRFKKFRCRGGCFIQSSDCIEH